MSERREWTVYETGSDTLMVRGPGLEEESVLVMLVADHEDALYDLAKDFERRAAARHRDAIAGGPNVYAAHHAAADAYRVAASLVRGALTQQPSSEDKQ